MVWQPVATLKQLVPRKKMAVEVDGTSVALFFIKDTIYALNDVCIHDDNRLSKGSLLSGKIVCPGHQWSFDPRTGKPTGREGCQPIYAVEVSEDGMISVDVTQWGSAGCRLSHPEPAATDPGQVDDRPS